MRFWLRAVAGGMTDDLQAIADAETAVFGGVRGKEGPTSGVSMRQIGKWPTGLPKDPELKKGDDGAQYLAYGRIRVKFPKLPGHVPAGSAFELAFATPQSRDPEGKLIAAAAHCLWVCSVFGGLGGRSRRGYGAFAIAELTGTAADGRQMTLPALPWNCSEVDLPQTISDGLSATRSELQAFLPRAASGCAASVSHLPAEPRVYLFGDCPVSVNSSQEASHSSHAAPDDAQEEPSRWGELEVLKAKLLDESPGALEDVTEDTEAPLEDHDGWKAALNSVGESMKLWLDGKLPDMDGELAAGFRTQSNAVKDWLRGGDSPQRVDDLAFGLPRGFFSNSVIKYYRKKFDTAGSTVTMRKQIEAHKAAGEEGKAAKLQGKLNAAQARAKKTAQSNATTMFSPRTSGVERRASPLAVSLVGCNGADTGKRLKIILTALAGEFLPPGTMIEAERKVDGDTAVLPAPDEATVTDLITAFLTDLGAQPVFGGND